MNIKRTLLHSALVIVTAVSLAACGEETVEDAMSNTGDAVEQTMDGAGDMMNDTGEVIKDSMTDLGNAVEDTCEELKEGANAVDTDC